MNAIGMYIFGGSQSIGHLQTGFKIDRILEMTNDMHENNSYHFIKNYPDIPVILPKDWWNADYLNELSKNKYDLLFANNPCSGLSQINKNANVNQPINNKFYDVFNVIEKLQPKVFLIENAPTTVTTGTPILQNMVKQLWKDYYFTIIRDMAGNHGVAMKRMRTLILGWNKNTFSHIPIVKMNKQAPTYVKDVLYANGGNNLEFESNRHWSNLEKYYDLVETDSSVLRTCCKHKETMEKDFNEIEKKATTTALAKFAEGKNIWDKSPWRISDDKQCMSITSVSEFIHPKENRDFYIREYARLMGYPEDFIFYPNECKCKTIQCIAQGVPVNFIKYISSEIKTILEGNYNYIEDANITFQHHIQEKLYKFKVKDFLDLECLNKYNGEYQKLNQ